MAEVYRLKVTQVEQVCFFELTWGKGRQLSAKLSYPHALETLYQSWQRIYLNYYQSALKSTAPIDPAPSPSALRGRAVISGQISTKTDWHGQLVQAEAKLLYEFHQWLRSAELFDIRSELGRKAITHSAQSGVQASALRRRPTEEIEQTEGLDLLITCDPTSLGRLPWEAWEINAEFGSTQPFRIARAPVNVRAAVNPTQQRRSTARILVILGDDTGLDFAAELEAIATLKRLAHITLIGWQPGTNTTELKQTICNTIANSAGWDMLLFFGHSNEANAVGGQIAIAPNTTLSLRELTPYLQTAKTNGLKFALFNSCKGLDIATSLINIGLNQVAIMREPVHNRVAQSFLIQFMQSLVRFDDVHTALQKATQALRSESNLTYPSAHLVPSLFRHSDAVLFRLQPVGVRAGVRSLLPPTRWQKVAITTIAALSFLAPVTESLMSRRLWVQALYRNATGQLSSQTPPPTATPPVILVQIDEQSIREGIPSGDPYPMDRAYLAKIVERLTELNAQVVGVDYLLDRPQAQNDSVFSDAIARALEKNIAFVFGAILEPEQEVGIREEIASLDSVMQGHTHTPKGYLRIPQWGDPCYEKCPFSYTLALTQKAKTTPVWEAITETQAAQNTAQNTSRLRNQTLRRRLLFEIKTQNSDPGLNQLHQLRLSPWSSLSRWWRQRWLHPLIDFSLPPTQAYDTLSAYYLLNRSLSQLSRQFDWENQIVIIASGGYSEAGTGKNKDYSEPSPATRYWYQQQNQQTDKFTGGQTNAYAVHHFLKQHYIVPLPDSWVVGLSLITSAGIVFFFSRSSLTLSQKRYLLLLISLSASLATLQLYISAQLLVPWLLPSATLWIFCLPTSKSVQAHKFSK